ADRIGISRATKRGNRRRSQPGGSARRKNTSVGIRIHSGSAGSERTKNGARHASGQDVDTWNAEMSTSDSSGTPSTTASQDNGQRRLSRPSGQGLVKSIMLLSGWRGLARQ